MHTVYGEMVTNIEVSKSIFMAHIRHVETPEAAKQYITLIREQYADATHHVSAYIVGKTGEYGHSSDDGEPSGTAGFPVLDVFRKNNLTNFVCVVTRYFGGIKLGAGGLIRAYSKAASSTLEQMHIVPIIEYQIIALLFDYNYYDLMEHRLQSYEIIHRNFDQKVALHIKVPKMELSQVMQSIIELTNNQCQINLLDEAKQVDDH